MGASGWHYFVPYQADIQQALDALRQDVLASGAFYHGQAWWRGMKFEDFLPPVSDEASIAEYRRTFDHLQSLQPPTTIDEWLEWNGVEGTHSILDVDRVVDACIPPTHNSLYQTDPQSYWDAEHARDGTVAPLSADELQAVFGTLQPSKAQVEAQLKLLYNYCSERGIGRYVVVYAQDQPQEILFIGFSGD